MSSTRPFREDDAPGRIPESLIDSVLDGAVDERTRREVARALRHDPRRRRDVAETIEALHALRTPVDCPDLTDGVLRSLDRRRRFLSPAARRTVRRTRTAGMAVALLALLGVAGAQRAMPRLASIGAQPTPVTDVARAVQADTTQAAGQVFESVRIMQASMPSLAGTIEMPGRSFRTGAEMRPGEAAEILERRFRMVTLDGRVFVVEPSSARAFAVGGRGFVSSMVVTADRPDEPEDERPAPLP